MPASTSSLAVTTTPAAVRSNVKESTSLPSGLSAANERSDIPTSYGHLAVDVNRHRLARQQVEDVVGNRALEHDTDRRNVPVVPQREAVAAPLGLELRLRQVEERREVL